MKDLTSTDLSDLFDWTPPYKENAAAAGPRNGVETSAAQKIACDEHTEIAPENQGCDLPHAGAMFADVKAQRIEADRLSLRQLQQRLTATTAPNKAALPQVKLGTFGNARAEKGSLRHDANLLSVSGVTSFGPQSKPVKSTTDLSDLFREPADRAEVRRALDCITDADDRDTWLKIAWRFMLNSTAAMTA